jgi:predicted nucleic acid-binding protein
VTVLADTSVWVEYLRLGVVGPAAELDALLAAGEVVICGPVAAELIAGVASHRRHELWSLLMGLPWAEIGRNEWYRVGEVAATLRGAGQTVALTHIEIAVAAVSNGAQLWSRDSDFNRVEAILDGLERFSPSTTPG